MSSNFFFVEYGDLPAHMQEIGTGGHLVHTGGQGVHTTGTEGQGVHTTGIGGQGVHTTGTGHLVPIPLKPMECL